MENNTDTLSQEHRRVWQRKPALRAVYQDLFRRLDDQCADGPVLEVGGGSGNYKDWNPQALTIDIQALPWVNVVADAHRLPFSDQSFQSIIMLDTLHHLERPRVFFEDALRVLRPAGRVVLVEPMISPLSYFFYKFFHAEPVDMGEDPLAYKMPEAGRDPFDSNQAIPTLLFRRGRREFETVFPGFTVRQCRGFSLFAYPLSGGFQPWSLLPAFLAPGLQRLEKALEGLLAPLIGFRMLVVIEKDKAGL